MDLVVTRHLPVLAACAAAPGLGQALTFRQLTLNTWQQLTLLAKFISGCPAQDRLPEKEYREP